MKKLLGMLIFLFLLYLGIQFAFTHFGKGENYSYEIEKDGLVFGVDEDSNFWLENNEDNYYFKVFVNDREFIFQTNHDFNKLTQVITDIKYFKNDKYECILPIFKENTLLMDVLCYTGDNLTYYYNLVGKDTDLDRFVKGITIYDASKWTDTATSLSIEGVTVYKNNLISNHYVDFTNYKGIFNISKEFNSTVYNINLYKTDERTQKIGLFLNEYYISADYNEEFEFNKFNIVDLVKLETTTIASNTKISIDSYIQGVVDGKIYLYDKDNKKQYEIDINKKTVVEASANTIKYYDKGTWSTMTIAQANLELKFVMSTIDYTNDSFARIDKVGDTTGYYYLYQKGSNGYNAYRMNIQDKGKLTYLFTTKTINNIYYAGNYVYFVSGSDIKIYNDLFGIRKIATYAELEFNQNINFNVYVK